MKELLCALGGALIGSAVTFLLTKKAIERKYDSLYQADVDEYKERVKERIATDPTFVEDVKNSYETRKKTREKKAEEESVEESDKERLNNNHDFMIFSKAVEKYDSDPEDEVEEENSDLEFYVGSREPEPSYDKNAKPERVTEEYADYCELELEYDVVLYKWRVGDPWLSTYDNDTIDLEELFEDRVDILFDGVAEGDTVYIADDSTHILYNIFVNP